MIKKQMYINAGIIVLTLILAIAIFPQPRLKIQNDIEEGELFNDSIGTLPQAKALNLLENRQAAIQKTAQTSANPQNAQAVPSDSQTGLQEMLFYTDLSNVPAIFVAKRTSKKEDSLISVFATAIAKPAPLPDNLKNRNVKPQTTAKTSEQKAQEVKDEVAEIAAEVQKQDIDYSVLNSAIAKTNATFYYPANDKNFDGVSVGILTITPYENNQQIVKFRVKNNTTKLFFVANFSIEKNGRPLLIKKFFDNVVNSGSTKNGIFLMPASGHNEVLTFKLLESEGLNRTYEINIKVP